MLTSPLSLRFNHLPSILFSPPTTSLLIAIMGLTKSLDDTSIPEKLFLLSDSDEEATVPTSAQRPSHQPRAVCRIIILTVALVMLSPLAFIYPLSGLQFLSRKPIVATGRFLDPGPSQSSPLIRLHDPEESGICMTPECVHAASEILYNLSPEYKKIDPCTDFEELVCGGWRERHDLRVDQGDAFTGTIMSETSQTLLRHILEASYPETSAVSTAIAHTTRFGPLEVLTSSSILPFFQPSSHHSLIRSTRRISISSKPHMMLA